MIKFFNIFRTIFAVMLSISIINSLLSPLPFKMFKLPTIDKPRPYLACCQGSACFAWSKVRSVPQVVPLQKNLRPGSDSQKPMLLCMTAKDLQPLPSRRLWRPWEPQVTCLIMGLFTFDWYTDHLDYVSNYNLSFSDL